MPAIHDNIEAKLHAKNSEVFPMTAADFLASHKSKDGTWMTDRMQEELGRRTSAEDIKAAADTLGGWYFWLCFPGCLPGSGAIGPYKTEQGVMKEALRWVEDE